MCDVEIYLKHNYDLNVHSNSKIYDAVSNASFEIVLKELNIQFAGIIVLLKFALHKCRHIFECTM